QASNSDSRNDACAIPSQGFQKRDEFVCGGWDANPPRADWDAIDPGAGGVDGAALSHSISLLLFADWMAATRQKCKPSRPRAEIGESKSCRPKVRWPFAGMYRTSSARSMRSFDRSAF